MGKKQAVIFLCMIIAAVAAARFFAVSQTTNADPSQDAALNAWIARQGSDPEYQRLRSLDQTPGTGGILVDEKEILPPLLPPESAAALSKLAPLRVESGNEKPAISAPTDWEIRQQVRKEIKRARLEEPWLFDCASSPCR